MNNNTDCELMKCFYGLLERLESRAEYIRSHTVSEELEDIYDELDYEFDRIDGFVKAYCDNQSQPSVQIYAEIEKKLYAFKAQSPDETEILELLTSIYTELSKIINIINTNSP